MKTITVNFKTLSILLLFSITFLCGQATSAANLWDGEEIRVSQGYPFLVRFFETEKAAPIVVLIPGGNALARFYYGGEGTNKEDFLAYWLQEQGYNVLAVSYPLVTASGAFDTVHPDITVQAWGQGAAEVTQSVMEENNLTGSVIVGVWSMGGKSVQPFAEAAKRLGLPLDFHVALASTPPLITSKTIARMPKIDPTGVMAGQPGAPGATISMRQIAQYNEADSPIIPEKSLREEYTGKTPVQLTGAGLRYDAENNQFVRDVWADMQDTKFFALNFPLVAAAIPTWKRDARHVLTDHATWGYLNANTIFHQYVGGLEKARKLTNDQLLAVRDISRRSSQDLTMDIEGNHFFFIGRKSAQETAAAIKEFEERVARLKQELNAILNQ